MKTHNLVPVAVTLGGKKIGELLVSVEMADELKFNPWLPDEPELNLSDDLVKNGLQE